MSSRAQGPIEAFAWPERLRANAVTPGEEPRIFGYAVDRDLAVHYRFSDVIYLSVRGALPDDVDSSAFEALLTFAAPTCVAEAPSHATALVALCGGTSSALLGVAALGLGEQARSQLAECATLLACLDRDAEPDVDATVAARGDVELSAVRATTVLRLFADAGVAADRLTAIGYADTRPVEPNLLADGRARNRRVTILIDSEIPEKGTELDLQGQVTARGSGSAGGASPATPASR